ncbi:hypothetical protein [Phaeodactylibacter xiamenensis]|uniref:hypothetical protein n=1 Tax=Phaeodactylibacter xiamenensis TaxID=1524460 RepID=UPI0024A8B35D|nr:hypothetical protein [Phaeodactylibacter xiamenensis]
MQYSDLNRLNIHKKIAELLSPYLSVDHINECIEQLLIDKLSVDNTFFIEAYSSPKRFFEEGLSEYGKGKSCTQLTTYQRNHFKLKGDFESRKCKILIDTSSSAKLNIENSYITYYSHDGNIRSTGSGINNQQGDFDINTELIVTFSETYFEASDKKTYKFHIYRTIEFVPSKLDKIVQLLFASS